VREAHAFCQHIHGLLPHLGGGWAVTWFKVCDTFAFHHKTVKAGNAALGLWVRAGSWCSQHLTDGYLPADIASTMGTRAQAKRLVAAGLWLEADGGYQFHDWGAFNPLAGEVVAGRKRAATKQKIWRDRKKIPSGSEKIYPRSTGNPRSGDGVTGNAIGCVTGNAGSGIGSSSSTGSTSVAVGAARQLSVTQRSKRITDAYAAAEPLCNWPAVNGVVIKAIKSEKFTDEEVLAAVLRLAGEGRSVTVEVLRVELSGFTPGGQRTGTATRKTQQALNAGRRAQEILNREELE
jgi:hypothetical protein